MLDPTMQSPVLEAQQVLQETVVSPEVAPDHLYDLSKFTDADGNVAFRWEEASPSSELKSDVSAEADAAFLGSYLAERAITRDTPEEQQKIQEYFANNMRQIVERRDISDTVHIPMGFHDADENGIDKIDQMRLGAIRGTAREMGLAVGPFVWDKKTQQISFKAIRPSN